MAGHAILVAGLNNRLAPNPTFGSLHQIWRERSRQCSVRARALRVFWVPVRHVSRLHIAQRG